MDWFGRTIRLKMLTSQLARPDDKTQDIDFTFFLLPASHSPFLNFTPLFLSISHSPPRKLILFVFYHRTPFPISHPSFRSFSFFVSRPRTLRFSTLRSSLNFNSSFSQTDIPRRSPKLTLRNTLIIIHAIVITHGTGNIRILHCTYDLEQFNSS